MSRHTYQLTEDPKQRAFQDDMLKAMHEAHITGKAVRMHGGTLSLVANGGGLKSNIYKAILNIGKEVGSDVVKNTVENLIEGKAPTDAIKDAVVNTGKKQAKKQGLSLLKRALNA